MTIDPCDFGNPVPCLINPGLQLTRYPCQLDDPRPSPNNTRGLVNVIDNVTSVNENVFNRYRDSILAIEGELGIQPSGTYTTVRARLDAMQQTMCLIWQSIGSSSFGGGDGYAASGTATLIDGYVLVTPPGGIADDAVILFSRKTSSGDLGEINISSQDGTRFSLTSSSPFDTSVINWAWFSRSSSFIPVGGSGGGDGYQPIQDRFVVGTNGQTSFTLSQNPLGPMLVFIDGIKQDTTDFSITTTTSSFLIWNGSVSLIVGDVIEVLYFIGGSGGGVLSSGIRFAGYYAVNTPTNVTGNNFTLIGAGNVAVGSGISGDTWICRLSMDANCTDHINTSSFRIAYSINGGPSVIAPGASTSISFTDITSGNKQVNLEVVITGITANTLTFYPEAQGDNSVNPSCSITRLSLVINKA
jgi:hypothetical protein